MSHVEVRRVDLGVLLRTPSISPEEAKAQRMARLNEMVFELTQESPRNMLLVPTGALEKWLEEEAKQ